jgi:hypothetical protein
LPKRRVEAIKEDDGAPVDINGIGFSSIFEREGIVFGEKTESLGTVRGTENKDGWGPGTGRG